MLYINTVVFDSSIERLPKLHNKQVKATLDAAAAPSAQTPIIETIQENAGGGMSMGIQDSNNDDYDRYDPEPGDDYAKRMEGWELIHSKIELTDTSGHNRTAVIKRDGDISRPLTID
jgi:hypothetical protein